MPVQIKPPDTPVNKESRMSSKIEKASEAIAKRLETPERGFVEWVVLLMPVLQQLLSCLFENDDVGPAEVQSRVRQLNARNPARLLRRTKMNMRKQARRDGQRMSDAQAEEAAQAAIDECLNADQEDVAAAGREAQASDFSGEDFS